MVYHGINSTLPKGQILVQLLMTGQKIALDYNYPCTAFNQTFKLCCRQVLCTQVFTKSIL